jgi:hypothetical protein
MNRNNYFPRMLATVLVMLLLGTFSLAQAASECSFFHEIAFSDADCVLALSSVRCDYEDPVH